MRVRLMILLGIIGFSASPLLAASPTALGQNGSWESYTYKSSGHRVCYMLSAPDTKEGSAPARKPSFVFITHRPHARQFDEVTFDIGYIFKTASTLKVTIRGQSFSLATDQRRAWAEEIRLDKKIVAAMKNGDAMTIEGESSGGVKTTDTYSLKGFTAGYRLISEQCR